MGNDTLSWTQKYIGSGTNQFSVQKAFQRDEKLTFFCYAQKRFKNFVKKHKSVLFLRFF